MKRKDVKQKVPNLILQGGMPLYYSWTNCSFSRITKNKVVLNCVILVEIQKADRFNWNVWSESSPTELIALDACSTIRDSALFLEVGATSVDPAPRKTEPPGVNG